MKLELYKPYLTQGGHKAVVVGYNKENGLFDVWHSVENKTFIHATVGKTMSFDCDYDLIAEWQEPKPPRTCEFWLNVYEDSDGFYVTGPFNSKIKADKHAYDRRIACKHVVWTEGE
jgi:hypothetical protein